MSVSVYVYSLCMCVRLSINMWVCMFLIIPVYIKTGENWSFIALSAVFPDIYKNGKNFLLENLN